MWPGCCRAQGSHWDFAGGQQGVSWDTLRTQTHSKATSHLLWSLNCKAASSTLNLPKTQHRLPLLQDFRDHLVDQVCVKPYYPGGTPLKVKGELGFLPQPCTFVISDLPESVVSLSDLLCNAGPGSYTENPRLFSHLSSLGIAEDAQFGVLPQQCCPALSQPPRFPLSPFFSRTGRTSFMVLFGYLQGDTCSSRQSETLNEQLRDRNSVYPGFKH